MLSYIGSSNRWLLKVDSMWPLLLSPHLFLLTQRISMVASVVDTNTKVHELLHVAFAFFIFARELGNVCHFVQT